MVSQFSLENPLLIATLHMGPSQEVENLEVTKTRELHMELLRGGLEDRLAIENLSFTLLCGTFFSYTGTAYQQ